MKKVDSIDLAKLLGSILIFTMHCGALNDYDQLSMIPQLLARWGVPFFFLCSAYFLFSKSSNGNIEKSTLRKYVYRIGMLYIAWFIFNLPDVIYHRLYSKDLTALGTWLVFLKNTTLSSTFVGSWFLASCIFSAWFVYLLCKKIKTKTVLGITFVFYLLCVFTSAYYGVLLSGVEKVLTFLCFPLNIFNGCFYFALGKYIADIEGTSKLDGDADERMNNFLNGYREKKQAEEAEFYDQNNIIMPEEMSEEQKQQRERDMNNIDQWKTQQEQPQERKHVLVPLDEEEKQ